MKHPQGWGYYDLSKCVQENGKSSTQLLNLSCERPINCTVISAAKVFTLFSQLRYQNEKL